MITRRRFLASSILTGLTAPAINLARAADMTAAWRNWSGHLVSNPVSRQAPASEAELMRILTSTSGPIRPVGAGHSFTPLVPTNGILLVLDKMSGIISHNTESKQATLWAGTRISDIGPLLHHLGQAMFNLPDIDRQTYAGAIATSTHGTGRMLKSMSGYVTGLRLLTLNGDVHDLDEQNNADLFHAARVSFGALGVITRITVQNREPFRLKTRTWIEETESVLEKFDQAIEEHQHFEIMPLVHSDYSLVISNTETNEPLKAAEEDDGGEFLAALAATPVMLRKALINALVGEIETVESVDESFNALTNLRFDRFNEMEYSIPVESGPDCLREVLATIERESIDVVFPLEYRIVQGDDTWLGMSAGAPRITISVHRMASHDYRPFFDRVEPIFWKYNGRPHWGKVHSLEHDRLKRLYPRFDDFVALQTLLDPEGRMLNDHLKYLLGRKV